jgi:hypothetical protein
MEATIFEILRSALLFMTTPLSTVVCRGETWFTRSKERVQSQWKASEKGGVEKDGVSSIKHLVTPEIRTECKVRPSGGFHLRKEDDTAVRYARISLEGEANDVVAGRGYGGCHVLG